MNILAGGGTIAGVKSVHLAHRRDGAAPEDRRPGPGSPLAVVGLCGLAVSQPLLSLFGDNPEFFVASHLTRPEIIVFALVVAFAPAVLLGLVDLLVGRRDPRAGRVVHESLVGVLAAVLALSLLRHTGLSTDWLLLGIGAAVGWLVVVAERRSAGFATALRYLAVTPVIFLAVFLLGSPAFRLLTQGEAEAVGGVVVDRPAPIVVLHLDEFPLSSLLRADGQINDVRFPNFARLAARSTWYRNASAPTPYTESSVPATLTGVIPAPGSLPTSIDHPRNLFTLLGSTYDERVRETITNLCPGSICNERESGSNARSFGARETQAVSDAGVVLAHAVLPPGWRRHLPALTGTWAGFGRGSPGGGSTAASTGATTTSAPAALSGSPATAAADARGQLLLRERVPSFDGAVADLEGMGPRTLWFTHLLLPHAPWVRDPNGHRYLEGGPNPSGPPADGVWRGAIQTRQGLQRHLIQLAFVDIELGRVIDSLDRQGIWDDAFVAVVADHGASFTEGTHYRDPTPDTVAEIFDVPMFVKLPGRQGSAVSDTNASTLDILPTLVAALGVHTDWSFTGVSLVGGESGRPPEIAPSGVEIPAGTTGFPVSFDSVLAVARRNQALFPYGDGVPGLYQIGPYGSAVTAGVSALDVVPGGHPGTWQLFTQLAAIDADHDPLPTVVDGQFSPDSGLGVGDEALIAVNGSVAGVAEVYERGDSGNRFTAVLQTDSYSDTGTNDVQFLVPSGPAEAPTFSVLPHG